MAGVVRCAARLTIINSNVLLKQTSKSLPCIMQTANISSKAWRDLNNIKRPPPYDYKNKDYTLTKSWFDKTSHRIDENSKVNRPKYLLSLDIVFLSKGANRNFFSFSRLF